MKRQKWRTKKLEYENRAPETRVRDEEKGRAEKQSTGEQEAEQEENRERGKKKD